MASLKEIKARINSVSSTLKITQAMKMVSSAKLRRVQKLYTSLEEYLHNLEEIASAAGVGCGAASSDAGAAAGTACAAAAQTPGGSVCKEPSAAGKVAIVVFSSDTSLCGSYNANIFKALQSRVSQLAAEGLCAEIIPVGEKVAKMAGKVYGSLCTDFVCAAENQTYEGIAPLLEFLLDGYACGRYSRVELLYMHFYTISRQKIECRTYLGATAASSSRSAAVCTADEMLVILEPCAAQIAAGISDLMLRARLYDTLLSAKLSEHACRMVAMQTASDNAEDLLGELRLTFNKQRQQDITEELSDISNSKS